MRTVILRSVVLLAVLGAGAFWHFPARAQGPPEAERLLQKAIQKETVDGDLNAAIEQYKKIVAANRNNHEIAAKALVQLGQCYEKLGNAEAKKAYGQVLSEYADQKELAATARARRAAMGGPGGAGGLVARRVLTDASGVAGVSTFFKLRQRP